MHLDVEKVCAAIEQLEEGAVMSADKTSLRAAAIAVCFIWEGGHVHNFEDLMACFSRTMTAEQVSPFDSLEQAQAWLKQSHDAKQLRCVSIAGKWYSVVYSLDRGDIELLHVPARNELTEVQPDADSITEQSAAAVLRATTRSPAPEDMESILTVLLALYFIMETGHVTDFESFLLDFDSRVAAPPLRIFGTQQEANVWLKSHPRPPPGAHVQIAGQKFSVGYDRKSNLRVWVRSPTLEELGLTGPTDEQDG